MAGLTNYAAQAVLNSLFGKTSNFGALASAPTIYVGLSSADPTEDGSGNNEPSGGSYARVATIAADWNAATLADPSLVDNANAITFPQASADWLAGADLTYAVLFDSVLGTTGENVLGSGVLGTAKPVLSGDTASFAAGELNITLD